jgi:hypothetical protein
MKPYALLILVSACVISGCKTQQVITTPGETVVITERVAVVDTVVLKDTVTITKDRLRIRLLKLPGDTVRVEAECAPDTVTVRTTHVEYNTEKLERQRQFTGAFFLLALVLFILLLLKK